MEEINLTVPFNLTHTVESGQFFQWRKEKDRFIIQTEGKLFLIHQENQKLFYNSLVGDVTPRFIAKFFRLDDPLDDIFLQWKDDTLISSAYEQFRGLRLIRQNSWECLVSFVCSMASNIPRITENIRTLSLRYGKVLSQKQQAYHRIPLAEELAQIPLSDLYDAGLGFRAKYLHAIAPLIAKGFPLEELRSLPYPEAKTALLRFHGVGEKVADCVLLFSLDHLQAFPTDTWIIKILKAHYAPKTIKTPSKLAAFARDHFGQYAGYAQQYLFHWARTNREK